MLNPTKVQQYRHEAERVRRAAKTATTYEDREALEKIAQEFDLLADGIERRTRVH